MPYIIKKYSNRKYYDAVDKKMINITRIGELIKAGEDIEIIEHDTGDDITNITLAYLILESEKNFNLKISSIEIMRALIKSGQRSAKNMIERYLFLNIDAVSLDIAPFKAIIDNLVERGVLSSDESIQLRSQLSRKLEASLKVLRKTIKEIITDIMSDYDSDHNQKVRNLEDRINKLENILN